MENLQSALFGYFPGKPGDVNLPAGMVSGAPQGTTAKETKTKTYVSVHKIWFYQTR